MAFSKSGTVITQTGTDLNLSGLLQKITQQTMGGTPASNGIVSMNIVTGGGTVIGTVSIDGLTTDFINTTAEKFRVVLEANSSIETCTRSGSVLTITYTPGTANLTLVMNVSNGISISTETIIEAAVTGVTTTFDGFVRIYTFTAGDTLVVNGTLTIDPEIERLHITANNAAINTGSSSRLNIGLEKTTTVIDSTADLVTTHFSRGVAITVDRAPTQFYGFGNNTLIFNGDVVWTGATVEISGNILFPAASTKSLWTRDAVFISKTINQGDIDPKTASTAAANLGTYVGVSDAGFGVVPVGRGWISNFFNGNYRIDGFTILSGGEMLFTANPATGDNSLSGTPNGIFEYAAQRANFAIFPNRLTTFTINNPTLSGSGNFLDVPIQSEGGGISQTSVPADAVGTVTTVFNSAGGTSMRIISGEQGIGSGPNQGRDGRSFGNVILLRNINFDCRDGLSNAQLSNASYYLQDFQHSTNNRRRAGNGTDHTANQIYTGLITSGVLASDVPVLVGEVIVPVITGSDPSLFNRRNTTNSPSTADPVTGFTYAMDVRSSTNTLGNDTFPVHIWQPAYNYLPITLDLSDGTTGTLDIRALMTLDVFFSGTVGATPTSVANLDEVYNALKNRKIVSQTTRTEPTTSTLWASEDNGFFDVGAKDLTVATGTATGGFTPTSSTYEISIGTNSSLIGGTIFRGLKSSLNTSCTNIDLPTVDIDTSTISNIPNPIPANSNLKSTTFGTFPFSSTIATTAVEAGTVLNGTYTESSDQSSAARFIVFDSTVDVSDLVLIFNSTGDVEIYGIDEDNFDTDPVNNGAGNVTYPSAPKIIVISTGVTGSIGQVYAEYNGTKVTPVQGTDANGNITFTHTTGVSGSFDIGVFIDGFNYSQLKGITGISGTMSFIPIDVLALDFSGFSSNTTLITALLTNLTVTRTLNTSIEFEFDTTTAEVTLTNHTAILGNDALLLTRRILENETTIIFLLAQTAGAAVAFTYDSQGWILSDDMAPTNPTLANPTKVLIVWDSAESKDLVINTYVKNATGSTQFDKIISDTPTLSPSFAPSPFVIIAQSNASLEFVEEIVNTQLDSRVLTAIK